MANATDAENKVDALLPMVGRKIGDMLGEIAGEPMQFTLIVWNQLPGSDVLTYTTIAYDTVVQQLEHMLAQLQQTDPDRRMVEVKH